MFPPVPSCHLNYVSNAPVCAKLAKTLSITVRLKKEGEGRYHSEGDLNMAPNTAINKIIVDCDGVVASCG
jgi:hypothetical protein